MDIKTGLHRLGRALAILFSIDTFIIFFYLMWSVPSAPHFIVVFILSGLGSFFCLLVYMLLFSALMRLTRWIIEGFLGKEMS